ncbi:MAG: ORF6N domain-containing protein [Bacteroidetes bacterium]|nr:ORF6N domain-containing protein [Bacteroidota bacterium]
MQLVATIPERIYEMRGERVMLDFDLAALYGVTTKVFNQSVKRHSLRFPADFMFQLNKEEWLLLQSKISSKNTSGSLRSQFVTSKNGRGGTRYLPHAFTEQGVAMLSGILNSPQAIQMNIHIIRAFVEIRKVLLKESSLKIQIYHIKEKIKIHDIQLDQIKEALENLLDEKAQFSSWDKRVRIGFKKHK